MNKIPIFSISDYFQQQFAKKVIKIGVDPGFSCPNRDGTIAKGGCLFCDANSFVPPLADLQKNVVQQFEDGLASASRKHRADAYLPYILANTGTHATIDKLRQVYFPLIEHRQSFGLAVSTRPDCLADDVFQLVKECQQKKFFWLELGLQTIFEKSLAGLNRGHSAADGLAALEKCIANNIKTVVHLIIGLPGEDLAMMKKTVKEVVKRKPFGIKFHPFHIVRHSKLIERLQRGEIKLQGEEEFINSLVDLLEIVPPEVTIHRLVADVQRNYLVAPKWLEHKRKLLIAIEGEFSRRQSYQGRRL